MNYSKKQVTNLGILAFAPLAIFIIWLGYYFFVLRDFIANNKMGQHLEMAETTVANYTPLFILLAINFIVAFIAFLYFLMNMWTRKNVPTGQKMVWVIFMATFNIVAFPVYWYMHVKNDHLRRNNPSPALS